MKEGKKGPGEGGGARVREPETRVDRLELGIEGLEYSTHVMHHPSHPSP